MPYDPQPHLDDIIHDGESTLKKKCSATEIVSQKINFLISGYKFGALRKMLYLCTLKLYFS